MLARSAMTVVIALGQFINLGTQECVTAGEYPSRIGTPKVPQRRARQQWRDATRQTPQARNPNLVGEGGNSKLKRNPPEKSEINCRPRQNMAYRAGNSFASKGGDR